MRNFLHMLVQRYRATLAVAIAENTPDDQDRISLRKSLTTLILADSALARLHLGEQVPDLPLQIAVVGPTQVGKSSLVNLLLKRKLTQASPVAGYTVHCQGYLVDGANSNVLSGEPVDHWLGEYFDMEAQSQEALNRQVLDEYSFTRVEEIDPQLAGIAVWDTPDFDSIESFGYRVPVLRAIALADLVVFVVSKEKYADRTVWDMLALLHELGIPVVVVMNKTPGSVRDELNQSFTEKYQRMLGKDASVRNIPALSFIDEYAGGPDEEAGNVEIADFRTATLTAATRSDVRELESNAVRFMKNYWSEWTGPISNDHLLTNQWRQIVDDVCDDLVTRYDSEYLDHSRYRETFQMALAELLVLLEVPGLAEPLGKLRGVVTWPMRKLLATARDRQVSSLAVKDDRNEERRLLEELVEHGLTRITSQVRDHQAKASQEDGIWWQRLNAEISKRHSVIAGDYKKSLDNYQALLKVELKRAAQALYQRLEEQPATLNSLRAARVTGDAAAVVLAVKSGGLGAVDLILAPAMLSVTSMLTEGVLGQYLQKVQGDLKCYQEKEVSSLLKRKLRTRLYPLAASSLDDSYTTATEIELQRAEEKLERGDV